MWDLDARLRMMDEFGDYQQILTLSLPTIESRHVGERLRAGDPLRARVLGPDRALFGTDCPFDPEGGPAFIRETIRAIESLDLPHDVRERLYAGNARTLLRLA